MYESLTHTLMRWRIHNYEKGTLLPNIFRTTEPACTIHKNNIYLQHFKKRPILSNSLSIWLCNVRSLVSKNVGMNVEVVGLLGTFDVVEYVWSTTFSFVDIWIIEERQ